jgi:metallo-beta-lactamase class B
MRDLGTLNARAIGIGAALAMMAGAGLVVLAQAPGATTVDGLVSTAKTAASTDWPGTFLRLCIPPPATGRGAAAAATGRAGNAARGNATTAGNAAPAGRAGRGAPAANATATAGPPRSSWYAEPAKVADNFYFLGTKVHNAWALVGSEGIIIIDALFDYASPDEIIGGLRTLGLDTNKVKYIVISHAHGDHDGGVPFLQDALPSARIVYGGPDWDAVDRRTGTKPKRDTVGADGMKLSVGDASVQIVTTPGHTPGTLSFLFEVKDNGKPLRVAYVGGTAIPFNGDAAYYDAYIASVRKMARAAADFGATALMSNHTEFDNGYYKAHTAAGRKPGAANPFDVGQAAVGRYFSVVEGCTSAAKLRAAGKP